MADAKILVVDDDPGVRRILHVILTRAGYNVSEARDGVEALQLVSDHRFDLITMDLVMDRMDGVDAISVLLNETQTPFLVVSAHLNARNRQELLERGVTEWVDKPFSTKLLLATVERLLEGQGPPPT